MENFINIMDKKKKKEYCASVHEQIVSWTENCDTKASIILAFIGVVATIVFSSDYILGTIESQVSDIITYWYDGIGYFSILSTLMFVSLFGCVSMIGASCCFIISVLIPRLNGPDGSIIFFKGIAKTGEEDYIAKVNLMSDEDLELDKLTQIYTCAKICDEKFSAYRKGIKYLWISLICLIAFVFMVILLNAF